MFKKGKNMIWSYEHCSKCLHIPFFHVYVASVTPDKLLVVTKIFWRTKILDFKCFFQSTKILRKIEK